MGKYKAYKDLSGPINDIVTAAKIYIYESGQGSQKGIYVYVNTVDLEKRDGYVAESFLLFADNAIRVKVLALNRFNAKKLEQVANAVLAIKEEIFEQYKAGNKEIVASLLFNIKI
jgi:hypothetical protein